MDEKAGETCLTLSKICFHSRHFHFIFQNTLAAIHTINSVLPHQPLKPRISCGKDRTQGSCGVGSTEQALWEVIGGAWHEANLPSSQGASGGDQKSCEFLPRLNLRIEQIQSYLFPLPKWEWWLVGREHKGTSWGDGNSLCIDEGLDYPGTCICQN